MHNRKTLMLVESALAVALAMILNKLGYRMAYGGSINLEMFPIFFIALRWGVGAGFLTGVSSGLLQLLIDPYVVHPAQVIMDYPLPFALLGLAGLVKNKVNGKTGPIFIFLGLLLGTSGRFIMHVLSGVIFFSQYAPEGQNVWLYSAIYNVTYLLPSVIVCLILMLIIWPIMNNALSRYETKTSGKNDS